MVVGGRVRQGRLNGVQIGLRQMAEEVERPPRADGRARVDGEEQVGVVAGAHHAAPNAALIGRRVARVQVALVPRMRHVKGIVIAAKVDPVVVPIEHAALLQHTAIGTPLGFQLHRVEVPCILCIRQITCIESPPVPRSGDRSRSSARLAAAATAATAPTATTASASTGAARPSAVAYR